MIMLLSPQKIAEVVSYAVEYQQDMGTWFSDGVRDAAVAAASMQVSKDAVLMAITDTLKEYRTIWAGDDPCDTWGAR